MILFLAGDDYRAESEQEIEKAFELGSLFFRETRKQDLRNLNVLFSKNIAWHTKRKNAEGIIRNAILFKEIKPELIKELDIIIDLAKKGKWDKLSSLLKI